MPPLRKKKNGITLHTVQIPLYLWHQAQRMDPYNRKNPAAYIREILAEAFQEEAIGYARFEWEQEQQARQLPPKVYRLKRSPRYASSPHWLLTQATRSKLERWLVKGHLVWLVLCEWKGTKLGKFDYADVREYLVSQQSLEPSWLLDVETLEAEGVDMYEP